MTKSSTSSTNQQPLNTNVNTNTNTTNIPSIANTMSAITSALVVPMMSAGSRYAPKFDGKNVTDFLLVFEAQAYAAGIPYTEWSDKVLQYCKSSIRQIIKNHELFKNKTWIDTKKVFYHYFPSEEEKTVPTPEGLCEFSRRC